MSKPAFDPNKPFEPADTKKPAFDPNKSFSVADEAVAVKTPEKSSGGSASEALLRGFAKGSNFGFQDEIEGALGGIKRGVNYVAGNTVGDKGILDAIKTGYTSDRDASRAYDSRLEKESPVSSIAGQLASSVPTIAAKSVPSIAAILGQGAAGGYGNSDSNTSAGLVQDAATGGLVAGGIAKGVGAVGNGASAILNKLKTQEALKALGAQKTQLKNFPEAFKKDTAQYALDKGLVNPFSGTGAKNALNNEQLRQTGQRLDAVRDTLPRVDSQRASNAINSQMNFNPNLEVNAPLTSQRDLMLKDVAKLTDPSTKTLDAKDLLDLKAALFTMARKGNGEINPGKDILEQGRRGISSLEKDMAGSSGYSEDLTKYAMGKKIEQLLSNRAAQDGNSILGMGGLVGGGGAIGAMAAGHPGIAALGALGVPAVRQKIGESSAVTIDAAQKLAKRLGVSPEKAAAILSRLSAVQGSE